MLDFVTHFGHFLFAQGQSIGAEIEPAREEALLLALIASIDRPDSGVMKGALIDLPVQFEDFPNSWESWMGGPLRRLVAI